MHSWLLQGFRKTLSVPLPLHVCYCHHAMYGMRLPQPSKFRKHLISTFAANGEKGSQKKQELVPVSR